MQLQDKYGSDKEIVLLGNYEEMACDGRWPIVNGDEDTYDHAEDGAGFMWMQKLPYDEENKQED